MMTFMELKNVGAFQTNQPLRINNILLLQFEVLGFNTKVSFLWWLNNFTAVYGFEVKSSFMVTKGKGFPVLLIKV